jgi:DNA-binding beta-propeller fold protein YncE
MKLQRVMDLATTLASVIGSIGDSVYGLAACSTYNCLYVSLHQVNYVCKFQLANFTYERVIAATQPAGLSINSAANVLVVCYGNNTILEYNNGGGLVRSITLQGGLTDPMHAVQLADGRYVVTLWNPTHSVCIVDVNGNLAASYKRQDIKGEKINALQVPGHVALSKDECIVVADMNNNRIFVMDLTLTNVRHLPLPAQFNNPFCVLINITDGRLYVGEWSGGRVMAFDNIINLAEYIKT